MIMLRCGNKTTIEMFILHVLKKIQDISAEWVKAWHVCRTQVRVCVIMLLFNSLRQVCRGAGVTVHVFEGWEDLISPLIRQH